MDMQEPLTKQERLEALFQAYAQDPKTSWSRLEKELDLTEADVRQYRAQKTAELSMPAREKLDAVIQDVLKPALWQAGFENRDTYWATHLTDGYLMCRMECSLWNREPSCSFLLCMEAVEYQGTMEDVLDKQQPGGHHVALPYFAPFCGSFSPIVIGGGWYELGGWRNGLPLDIPLADIEQEIRSHLEEYALPQLRTVRSVADWNILAAQIRGILQSREQRILNFYRSAILYSCSDANIPALQKQLRDNALTAKDATEHLQDWLKELEKHAERSCPNTGNYIRRALSC